MINAHFDVLGFLDAVKDVKDKRGLTWQQANEEIGLNVKSLHNWSHFRAQRKESVGIGTHNMTILALWARIDVRRYMILEAS